MTNTVITKFPQMLHGGDYNPDQWLDRPDILKEDIRLMKAAHVNCVSLGIFAWAALEPQEGRYELDWLEAVIQNLYAEGIYTILATPTGSLPNWLTEKYPEVMQTNENRIRNLPGRRHNFCYTSPVMREKTRLIDEQLAKRFGRHPGVILWHISNELGGNGNYKSACYCEHCQNAFRNWLKDKYQTLERLNQAWWTHFWSHTYTSWDQIEAPSRHGEDILHGLNLDWQRFVTRQVLDFYCHERDTVQQYSDRLPATANFMEFFFTLDYFKFKDDLDITSWDSYPKWHSREDDVDTAVRAAANHNIIRSLKRQPFLLMESTPSITNWGESNIQKRPGMHKLSSLQAVAHGSNSVQYFQWRKSRGSFEKFHGAVVGHDGTGDTRVFREVAQVGASLEKITAEVYNTCNAPQTAILFDWENWWGIEDAAGPKQEMDYIPTVLSHYKAFWELGIDVDFVDMDQEIGRYKIIVGPMLYLLKETFIEKIKAFVRAGGVYVSTYWSHQVNDTDLCYIGENPLEELLGVQVEEIDVLNEFYRNKVTYGNKSYEVCDLSDIVRLKGAEVIGTYQDQYYADTAALTKNAYGKGFAYHIASRNEYAFQKDFYRDLTERHDVERNLQAELPYGVTVSKRVGEGVVYFMQNYLMKEQKLVLDEGITYHDLESGERVAGEILLSAYGCRVLKRAE